MKRALLGIGLLFLFGCQKHNADSANLVVAGNPSVDTTITDGNIQYGVVGKKALGKYLLSDSDSGRRLLSKISADGTENPPPTQSGDTSLLLSFPTDLMSEFQMFGGVITKVSNRTDTSLGDLKLTDLTPLTVRPQVLQTPDKKFYFGLMGCVEKCDETSKEQSLVGIPIEAVSPDGKNVVLDLSSLGSQLNLIQILDPNGDLKLKTVSSNVVSVDYSLSTLVFDVEVTMVPVSGQTNSADATPVTFTVRWYLRLLSKFNPAFDSRPVAPGVGFFLTERGTTPLIQRQGRFLIDGEEAGPIHYYIKNVPAAYQPAFASSFDEWNDRFLTLTGHKIFSYEFVPAGDPLNDKLVTGDVRYNIVEWDLVNQATYGGLGPSISNQFTGEILTSNVLIQGPTIIDLYTRWFKGATPVAPATIATSLPRANVKLALTLANIPMRIHSQEPPYRDPAANPFAERNDFDALPAGVSFDQYMFGYFHDMLTHELGHNLGLRHNFRGNLGAADGIVAGKVTSSIMEYLGRDYRYLDHVGSYDEMAIRYGYVGIKPDLLNGYCTDEDQPDAQHLSNSAECTSVDATNDPFSFFEDRLKRAIDLLTSRGSSDAPTWVVDDMTNALGVAINGLGYYATSAAQTMGGWTNFAKAGRPTKAADVTSFVVQRLALQICDPALKAVIADKSSDAGRTKTKANLNGLVAKARDLLKALGLNSEAVNCPIQ